MTIFLSVIVDTDEEQIAGTHTFVENPWQKLCDAWGFVEDEYSRELFIDQCKNTLKERRFYIDLSNIGELFTQEKTQDFQTIKQSIDDLYEFASSKAETDVEKLLIKKFSRVYDLLFPEDSK